ncbi:hypothetical protein MMC24_001634 [Lignoscripta atroalba]|nr:hypothetical protein [Lignoscripta atroalba]
MRTVSKDDELVIRGANPRTGLVSPYVASDGSDDSGCASGYLGARQHVATLNRTVDGTLKWKQGEEGWTLDQITTSPQATSTAYQSFSRSESTNAIADQFVVVTPGADDPELRPMKKGQIRKYQESIERASKAAGGSPGFIGPDMLPSPRLWTPEAPSTTPNVLHKIRRKEIGSGVGLRDKSSDDVIINGKTRASSLPTPSKRSREQRRVRLLTPSHSIRGLAAKSNHAHILSQQPFLALLQERNRSPSRSSSPARAKIDQQRLRPDPKSYQVLSLTRNQLTKNRLGHQNLPRQGQDADQRGLENSDQIQSPDSCQVYSGRQPPLKPVSKYLPRLNYPPPSHFLRLPASYRGLTSLQSEHLRDGHQDQSAEVAYTTTITTTPGKDQIAGRQRPRVDKQKGSDHVSQVCRLAEQRQKMPYSRASLSHINTDAKSQEVGRNDGLKPIRQREQQRRTISGEPLAKRSNDSSPTAPLSSLTGRIMTSSRSETYTGWVVPDTIVPSPLAPSKPRNTEAKHRQVSKLMWLCQQCTARRTQSNEQMMYHPMEELWTTNRNNKGEAVGGVKNDVGCILIDAGPNEKACLEPDEMKMRACKDEQRKRNAHVTAAGPIAERHYGDEPSESECALEDCNVSGARPDMTQNTGKATQGACVPRNSLVEHIIKARETWATIERNFHASSKVDYLIRRLLAMILHLHRTLSPASPTLMVLTERNGRPEDYLLALWDVFLAVLYLFVLLNIVMVAGKMVRLLRKILRFICVPLRLLVVVVRWCLSN